MGSPLPICSHNFNPKATVRILRTAKHIFNYLNSTNTSINTMTSDHRLAATSSSNIYGDYSVSIWSTDSGTAQPLNSTMSQNSSQAPSTFPTWATFLVFIGILAILTVWCVYGICIAYKSSNDRQVAAEQYAQSQPETMLKDLSRKERKTLLLARFERSGKQTVCL